MARKTAFVDRLEQEGPFFIAITLLLIACAVVFPYPRMAMWLGFGIAGYSAIANDSIQTLGTFLSSNRNLSRWLLWLFIGGILAVTHSYGWLTDGGDIAFGRLSSIPQPLSFTFVSLAAPVILLILTRFRMPVSTTFLLLSSFSTPEVIKSMLTKTFVGYIAAFGAALAVWSAIAYLYNRKEFASKKYNQRPWRILQACSTAFLWSTWIMHDTANVAVYLPRSLTLEQMIIAIGFLVSTVGVIMFWRGGRIQVVVTEKTDITDVRAATIIDFVYAIVLLVFKEWNNIPMSTTWVFLGLLAGREIALTLFTARPKPYKHTLFLVTKDIIRAAIGLLISLLIVVFLL
jgi:hypothetical protein